MSDRINSVDVVFSSGELVVVTPPVYRGDSGQILTVSGIPFDVETMRVAFAADDDGVAIPQTGTITDSVLTVPIPNEILSAAFRKIRAYFAVIDTDSVTTVYQVIFPVAGAPEIVDVYEEASEAQRTAVDNIILAMESGEASAGAAPDIRSDRINSVDVVFAPGEAVVVTPPVYCGDSGQVLTVSGIPFDVGAMRVAFAADEDGVAIPKIGVIAENVLTVPIPNEILAVAHKKIRAYFAVIDTDSVTTVYQVIFPVAGAPEIVDVYEEASEAQRTAVDNLILTIDDCAATASAQASAAEVSAGRAETAAGQAADTLAAAVERAEQLTPVVTAEQTASGAEITIESVTGTQTVEILNGEKGEKGDKGDKGDTGATGPQGLKGDTGATGPQGPQGAQGETGATGATGPQGPQGPAGYTPVRGTDYWTAADQQQIVADVLAALPAAEGVGF